MLISKDMGKNFSLKVDQNSGIIYGYASVFDHVDEQNDRVVRGAFKKSLETWAAKSKMPKMLWQHQADQPIGIWTEILEDQKGLYVEGKLLLEVQRAREAYALIKSKVLDSLSIGFRVVKSSKGYLDLSRVRDLQEIDLQEISLVTFGANSLASVTQCKHENLPNPPYGVRSPEYDLNQLQKSIDQFYQTIKKTELRSYR